MLNADHIVDIGPGAGRHGGLIVAQGDPKDFLQQESPTTSYLTGEQKIPVPEVRREGNGTKLKLFGAKGHNLHNLDLELPLGKMICITGVSGSGKSSLIHDTLIPILKNRLYKSRKEPLPYTSIEGVEHLDKVIEVDQSPIGRTPRSNPATYTGVFTDIRALFTNLPEAKIRGYKAGRFSFNVKGGRCETCRGGGMKQIAMDFLPDVLIPCETCKGKRYNRETLEVRFKGKSISDVLNMTVEEAVTFFEHQPKILKKINTLHEVGLGYISLGQHATTLSGGEAQRVKLSSELSKRDTGKTLFVLDEPTTGLHFQDVKNLLLLLDKLVSKGNTVLIIEHNMDIIKAVDHIIDLGPEGGQEGGHLICSGSPEQVAAHKGSYTARYLAEELAIK
jgi:excinuclease ABC subunit A